MEQQATHRRSRQYTNEAEAEVIYGFKGLQVVSTMKRMMLVMKQMRTNSALGYNIFLFYPK